MARPISPPGGGGGNKPPVAVDDGWFAADAGASLIISTSQLLANDTDANKRDVLAIIAIEAGNGISATLDKGNVVVTTNDGFAGQTSFNYTVSDGHGGTDVGTVNVLAILPLPTFTLSTAPFTSVTEGGPMPFTMSTTDYPNPINQEIILGVMFAGANGAADYRDDYALNIFYTGQPVSGLEHLWTLEDTLVEPNEVVTGSLYLAYPNGTPARILASTTTTIVDNDTPLM